MIHTHSAEYNGYIVSVMPETSDDKKCDWRSYMVFKNGRCSSFTLPNELCEDRAYFRMRAIEAIEVMEKDKEPKMTRDEAEKKLKDAGITTHYNLMLNSLEALGLIEFDPAVKTCVAFDSAQFGKDFGKVKIELWTEGLVLWVGGEIKWKSWEKYVVDRLATYASK